MGAGDKSQTRESTFVRSLGDFKLFFRLGSLNIFSAGKSLS